MVKGILQLLAGVLLLPWAWGAIRALTDQVASVGQVPEAWPAFVAGVVTYLAIHTVFHKPAQLYDTGRQTVDAAVSKVGDRVAGGAKAFGALSHLVPLYTILLVVLYLIARRFRDLEPYGMTLIFLIGLTISLHWFMTVDALKEQQKTLVKSGYLAVVVLITVWTCGMLVGLLQLVFAGPSLMAFLLDVARISAQVYRAVFVQLFLI